MYKNVLFLLLLMCCTSEVWAQDVTLIKNANVWNGTNETLLPNYDVLIIDNLISEVAQEILEPQGAVVIDATGKTLIPGLSDAHVHLSINSTAIDDEDPLYIAIRSAKAAESFLMMGFTTVRDLGGPVMGLKRTIDEGLVPGPRIYPSGAFISQTSGHGDFRSPEDPHPYWSDASQQQAQRWGFIVDGVPEVLKASRENLKNGASQLKVMAGGGISSDYDPIHSVQFTPDELEAAVMAAADWDTYVTVHAYNATGIMRALEAGVKCIDHGHLINEEAMQMLKEKDAWLVPQSYWNLRPDPDPDTVPAARLKKIQQVRAGATNEMELAKKYDVNLAFGTDAYGPLGREQNALLEFTSRVRWYTPVEVLKQATSENARLFSLSGQINPYSEGKLGVIEEGAYADLLVYDGNPIEDIQVIVDFEEHLKLIMKDGKIFKNEL